MIENNNNLNGNKKKPKDKQIQKTFNIDNLVESIITKYTTTTTTQVEEPITNKIEVVDAVDQTVININAKKSL